MSKIRYRQKCLSQKINVCNICGDRSDLYVHHIDGDRENDTLSNLIPLCPSCHRKVHSPKSHNPAIDRYTDFLPDSAINHGPYSRTDKVVHTRPPDHDSVSNDGENLRERSTVVNVSEQGRAYVPKPVREALGIDSEARTVEITVRVEETED